MHYSRKKSLILVLIILTLSSLACLVGGEASDEPDLAATMSAMEATQQELEKQSSENSQEPQEQIEKNAVEPVENQNPPSGEFDYKNAKSGDIIYTTDFDNPNEIEDWQFFPNPANKHNFEQYIEDGFLIAYVEDAATTLNMLYDHVYMPRRYADVFIETAFDNRGQRRNNNISLICRASEEGWYEFSVSSSGVWFIYKYDKVNDSYSILQQGGVPNYDKNDTDHTISASCIGKELKFYYDGSPLKNAEWMDNEFDEGGVGLSVWSSKGEVEIEFDWFRANIP